jgi:methionine salvage enolase-phosphatase E1
MSTELSRLARLGLLHLIDKPEELQAALENGLTEIEEERQRLRELPSEPSSEQGQNEESK